MKLPNHESAILPREKIRDYLLSTTHPDGRHKAAFFLRFGFNRDSWQTLGEALRQHAALHDVVKKTMIKELDQIVLATDLPEEGLQKGDVGTVVLVHEGGKGYEVEFMTLDGETVAVVTLLAEQVRSIAPREIANARAVAPEQQAA